MIAIDLGKMRPAPALLYPTKDALRRPLGDWLAAGWDRTQLVEQGRFTVKPNDYSCEGDDGDSRALGVQPALPSAPANGNPAPVAPLFPTTAAQGLPLAHWLAAGQSRDNLITARIFTGAPNEFSSVGDWGENIAAPAFEPIAPPPPSGGGSWKGDYIKTPVSEVLCRIGTLERIADELRVIAQNSPCFASAHAELVAAIAGYADQVLPRTIKFETMAAPETAHAWKELHDFVQANQLRYTIVIASTDNTITAEGTRK